MSNDAYPITRCWAMPSPSTFSIPPIAALLARSLVGAAIIIDPFAGNTTPGTHTNDLNPELPAQYHVECIVHGKERQVSNDDHFWTVMLGGLLVWGTIVVSLVAVLT